jgi:putative serine protease PepD
MTEYDREMADRPHQTTPLWPQQNPAPQQPAPPPPAPPYAGPVHRAVEPTTGVPVTGGIPISGGVPISGGAPPAWQPPPPAGPYPPRPADSAGSEPHRGGNAARVLGTLSAALVLALVSGVAGGIAVHQYDNDNTVTGTSNQRPLQAAAPIDRSSLASIAAFAAQSVVDINTGTGEGSGVVLTSDGAILTNNHVVTGARGNTVRVTFNTGRTASATIVGTDPAGDLAVIKAQGVSGLTAAKFGNSDALQPGDTVLALGSPLGLQGSVTAGIVSALHRTIDEDADPQNGTSAHSIGDAIQTDAAINPGNSGGPLVNTSGEVVGINTAIATSGQGQGQGGNIGVGFAIPSNKAKAAADQLMKGGKVSHPFLGVQVRDGDGGGALVAAVTSGSPAAKAGIQQGDVITKVGSKNVTGSSDLVAAVQAGKPGDQLTLTLTRDGSEKQVTVTLAEAS